MPKLFLFVPFAALFMTVVLPACSGTEEPTPCDVDAGPACPSGYACYKSPTATAGSCITDEEAAHLTCGGIANLPCADGYACQGIDPGSHDGTGQCVPLPR
jgi:hypothetical protein